MSDDRTVGEKETKKEGDCIDEEEDAATTLQDDNNDSILHPSDKDASDINRLSDNNMKDDKHALQKREDNPTSDTTEDVKEVTEVQHVASPKHLSKQPTSSLDDNKKPSDNITSKTNPVIPGNRSENVTDTYDVITRKEVQGLTDWESIQTASLSEIPPIDPGVLIDLESRAKEVAHNLDHLLGTLSASLKSMSLIGVQSVEAYRKSIENVEETADISIKSMYTLIAKCEELNSHMGPLYTIAAQIKEIKSTLDVFESLCK